MLKGSLSAPRFAQFNTKHLHDMCHFETIDLNAAYQRDVVWTESKQIGLIQSLFLNYYVPPIIFALHENDDGETIRTCIDGKQRCTSIVHFIDGKIPFKSPSTGVNYYYILPAGKRGHQLPESMRRKFDQIQLQTVEYDRITDLQQRDIFQRVQMGVTLSAAEKLQAIAGPWPVWIIELQKKYISEEGTLEDALIWDIKRGRAFQNLAAFVILAFMPAHGRFPSALSMGKFLDRSDPPDTYFKRKVEMALSLFVNIATTPELYKVSFGRMAQRVAPVEFSFIALLIFSRMGALSLEHIARLIGDMRYHIRVTRGHKDVRSNERLAADFDDFFRTVPKAQLPGETPAAEQYSGDDTDARANRLAKRARRAEERDPTYRETATSRYDESEVVNGTRAAKKSRTTEGTNGSASTSASTTRPTSSVQRPGVASMDRAGPSHVNSSFGQLPPRSNNPYARRPPAPPQGYTPAQMEQWRAMQTR